MDTQKIAATREAQEDDEIDLLDLCSYFLSKLPILISTFIIGALAAGLITYYLITPEYTASVKMYMVSASSGSAVDLTDLNIGTSLSKDYEVLMQIRPIYEDIIEELNLDYTYDQMKNMIDIGNISDTRVVTITVTSPNPSEAENIANAVAEKAVDYLPDLMETSEPHIAERAILPTSASSPSLAKNTVIGAMIGLIISLAVLTILYLADDTLKNPDDIEKEFGVIPLAVIPEGNLGKRNSTSKKKGHKKKKGKVR